MSPPTARTLHMTAVCRLRYCPRTQAYAARRTVSQDQREILRFLKRYIAREPYHALSPDLVDLATSVNAPSPRGLDHLGRRAHRPPPTPAGRP